MDRGGIPEGTHGEFAYARAGKAIGPRVLALRGKVAHVAFLYGEFDWMSWRNALDVQSEPLFPGAPYGGKNYVITGTLYLMREMELGTLRFRCSGLCSR